MNVLLETVEAVKQDPSLGKSTFRARNTWEGGSQNCTTITDFYAAKEEQVHKQPFKLLADEPPMLAGKDEGGLAGGGEPGLLLVFFAQRHQVARTVETTAIL